MSLYNNYKYYYMEILWVYAYCMLSKVIEH